MPKEKHPPAFQFYVDDFVSDSAVDAMTNEEVGIYIRFLCKAWKEEPVGTIPSEDRVLMNWAKATPQVWKRCRESVLRAFTLCEDGRYHQKRMKVEWQKLLDNREAKSRAGKKGGTSRWHGDDTAIAQPLADPIAKNDISSSSSISSSFKDVDGAKSINSGEESERLISRAKKLQAASKIDCRDDGNRSLIAKTAVLWEAGEFSDDDIEQVIESFRKGGRINNRGGWLHRCLSNRCQLAKKDFNGLLARTVVPLGLMLSIRQESAS